MELNELTLEACKAHNTDFRHCNLQDAQFDYSDLSGCLFSDTNLSGASFAEAHSYDIDVNHNNIRHAKFSRHEAIRLLHSLEIELLD